ncbi:MAG: hypothetical protein ACYDBV_10365 [Nitrospiria bacterium]
MEENLDEILGITRCARCGERLNGEIDCPFCSLFPDKPYLKRFPKWIYITACFLTFPLSFPFVLRSETLSIYEKILISGGLIFWLIFYLSF